MLDVSDLCNFYASALGEITRRVIGRVIRQRWEHCRGHQMLALGFGGPYLERFRLEARRVLCFMPAAMGVVNWPETGPSASALIDETMLPISDGEIDRLLLIHALETSMHPQDMLAECWRILAPGGRIICVVPSRSGLWSRSDTTPFGEGQPHSRAQLKAVLRAASFAPLFWGEALYVPPTRTRFLLSSALVIERIGSRLKLPIAGVHIVEASKQVIKPVRQSGKVSLLLAKIRLSPVLAPSSPVPTRRQDGLRHGALKAQGILHDL